MAEREPSSDSLFKRVRNYWRRIGWLNGSITSLGSISGEGASFRCGVNQQLNSSIAFIILNCLLCDCVQFPHQIDISRLIWSSSLFLLWQFNWILFEEYKVTNFIVSFERTKSIKMFSRPAFLNILGKLRIYNVFVTFVALHFNLFIIY